jgi:glyoxylase-like metal-dependent hydrolase (beta-lactamase superfamily II)
VPEEPLRAYAEARRGQGVGISRIIEPDRPLLPGLDIETDLGTWNVYETPGHAPSHVCMFQPEHRMLISGDHLLGRVSLYYDYGYSPDPAGEFLQSLDVVERSTRACASPATAARSPTCRATSRPTARSCTSGSRRSTR